MALLGASTKARLREAKMSNIPNEDVKAEGLKLTKAQRAVLANVKRLGEVALPALLTGDVLWLADSGYLSRWPGKLPQSCRVRLTPHGDLALSERAPLTRPQRAMLVRARDERASEAGGDGCYLWGRHEMRTANVLRDRGLLRVTPNGYATLTPAGRASLPPTSTTRG